MPRSTSLLRLAVDERQVRGLLGLVPGVTPLRPAPADDADDGTSADGDRDASDAAVDTAGTDAAPTDAPTAADAVLTDDERRFSPWPGSPTAEPEDEDDGFLTKTRLLLAGGLVLGLGVIGVAIVLYRRRGSDGLDTDERSAILGDASERVEWPPESLPFAGDDESDGQSDDAATDIDAPPLIGMAFLAVAAAVLRRVRDRSRD